MAKKNDTGYPKTIYLDFIEGQQYPTAYTRENAAEFVGPDATVEVGVYELKKIATLKSSIVVQEV